VVRAADLAEVVDPQTGVMRSHLGPLMSRTKVEFVRLVIPPGASTGGFTAHTAGTIERIYLATGSVEILVAGKAWRLDAGDTIMYRASVAHELHSVGESHADVYLVVERP
jgi:quercetin dioxygenase-like cupin family protein